MPEPMITTSASFGKFRVERCAVSSGEGSECQKELVDDGVGRGQGEGSEGSGGLVRDMMEVVSL